MTAPLPRRTLLRASLTGALLVPTLASPLLTTAAGAANSNSARGSSSGPGLLRARPVLTHGVASGDPRQDGALIWTRSDRPARMVVEVSPTDSFHRVRRFTGPKLTPDNDGTGRFRITGLEPNQRVHYRVYAQGEQGACSEALEGVFTTAPARPSDIRFLWSGDVVGQGWGRNKQGGMSIFGAMADREPDFFIHSGDAIYADNPVPESQKQNDGAIYLNETSPAKTHVAQTVDDYRGNYNYNLGDPHYLRFNATMGQLVQWDDHEVTNNWYPNESLAGQNRPGYTQLDVNTLARNAYKAWSEWQPVAPNEAADGHLYRKISYGPLLDVFLLDMRSYKDPNPDNWSEQDDGGILGATQTRWLIDELNKSRATWKVVANDLPISIVVPDSLSDPEGGPKSMEAVAQGDNGAPRGREIAFSKVLSGIKHVKNVVFFTADVHYTAAISYQPERASFSDFSPFWEFVSGPLNAGAFPQSPLDGTFGARYEYVHAPEAANVSPAEGFQHFGEVNIDQHARTLTVHLRDAKGTELYQKTLEAR